VCGGRIANVAYNIDPINFAIRYRLLHSSLLKTIEFTYIIMQFKTQEMNSGH
jgi:hypothetical protein